MEKISLLIDDWYHKELKEYLMSLKGVINVNINDDDALKIDVDYDSKQINDKIVKMEVSLFLDSRRFPTLLTFDRHFSGKLNKYTIKRKDVCCEFCFKGAIEDLFAINAIKKVQNNFYEQYYKNHNNHEKDIIIDIFYDSNVLNAKELKNIEESLNI